MHLIWLLKDPVTKYLKQSPKILIPESYQIHAVQTLTYLQLYQMTKMHHQPQKDYSGDWRVSLLSVAS